MNVGATVLIKGLVQGVGFRYFVCQAAGALDLYGTVRNLHDGSVEIQVEGQRSSVEEFIKQLSGGSRFSKVTGVQVNWLAFSGKYKIFSIVL
jgi:acylphosphatase